MRFNLWEHCTANNQMRVMNEQHPNANEFPHVGQYRLGFTKRRDRWWLEPTAVAAGLLVFGIYATWAALVGTDYRFGPYLSPFYSPLIPVPNRAISPALVVLWAPLGFRLTCYYYRKAYYRAFFFSPPACAVSESVHTYRGESGLLGWLPTLHRWFLYVSIVVLSVLWYDAVRAFDFNGSVGVGLGSLILTLNACGLTFFTFGCHAFRSVIGGNQRCFGCSPIGSLRRRGWNLASRLTSRHPLWAWISLYSVAFADLYVRLLALGLFKDPHVIF